MQSTRTWYAEHLTAVDSQRDRLKQLDRTLNITRAVLFFVGVLLLILGWLSDDGTSLGGKALWWSGWLVLAAFFVVVTFHEYRREELEQLRTRRAILRRLLARLDRQWDRLPSWKPSDSPWTSKHQIALDVADDLDLFGDGSLMQLISMAYTGPGLRTLARWMVEPCDRDRASARSLAARSLVEDREARVRFYQLARTASLSAAQPDAFSAWASGPRWLEHRRWLLTWAWIAPFLSVLLFVVCGWFLAREGQGFDWGLGLVIGAIPILINVLITVWSSGPIHGIFARAVNRRGDIEGYLEMFAQGSTLPESPALVAEIRERLVGQDDSAIVGMSRLGTLARWIAARRGGSSYIVFLVLQLLVLWDVHLLSRLEAWQSGFGKDAEKWFDALGQLEALQSLAAVYDDNPQWSVPEWLPVDDEARLTAQQIGHPLLRDDVRVTNDVAIGPGGSLLLVTGSNMSGKSTMLRSVGLNVVLAGAGGPVCAQTFKLPSVELATSIRVRDSVKEGVSFYMAELHRLRDVVAQARQVAASGDRLTLYLLDEILQGTNSRERAIAVVQVLRHLLDLKAIGAISTHDLELAEDPELVQRADVVHFRETIITDESGRETMQFDYRMRPGVTPTTNALRLLELVGLGKREA